MWAGTETGCYQNNYGPKGEQAGNKKIFTFKEFRSPKNDHGWCNKILPIQPIKQDNFWGKYICGKRGGLPFKQVLRVNP